MRHQRVPDEEVDEGVHGQDDERAARHDGQLTPVLAFWHFSDCCAAVVIRLVSHSRVVYRGWTIPQE